MLIYYLEHPRYSINELKETFSINFLQAVCLSTHLITKGRVYLSTYFNSDVEGAFGTYKHILEDLSTRIKSSESLKLISEYPYALNPPNMSNHDDFKKENPFFDFEFKLSVDSINGVIRTNAGFKAINPRSGNFVDFQKIFSELDGTSIEDLNSRLGFSIKSNHFKNFFEVGNDYYSALSFHTLKNISRWQNYPVFKWPTINFDLIRGVPDFFSNELKLKEEGLLGKMGYHVGSSGVGQKKRREILADVLELPFEQIQRQGFNDYWGNAKDTSRLKAMAFAIFCFINCRKNNPSMIYAIGDWRSDLEWLKTTYYDNLKVKPFEWPD